MGKQSPRNRVAGIGDQAVLEKTGRTWGEWIKLLDKAGAASMSHKDIARYLYQVERVPEWWSQMVTVGYEQARGLRKVHETARGFQISGSKTIDVPIVQLYKAWSDEKRRNGWLGEHGLTVRKSTPNKSMRITWSDGESRLSVNFYAKAAKKSQVALEHSDLRNERDAKRMKQFWSRALADLKSQLESRA